MQAALEIPVELTPQQALYLRQRRKGLSIRRAASKSGVSHRTGFYWEKALKPLIVPQLPKD